MILIDADKLKAEIERRRLCNRYVDTEGYEAELLEIIGSLQQEQPKDDWKEKRKKECPFRIADGCKQYAGVISECTGACSWVVDYPKFKEIQDKKKQEQSDMDLEKEIREWYGLPDYIDIRTLFDTAKHFYELGLNAKEE